MTNQTRWQRMKADVFAFYKKTTYVERILHACLFFALLSLCIEEMLENYYIHDHTVFWVQTLSGNWPGEPSTSVKEAKGEFLLSAMIALAINLATLGALGAGFVRLIRLERNMIARDVVALHELLLREHLVVAFTKMVGSDYESKVSEAVDESFRRAHKELLEYGPVVARTEESRNQFNKQVDNLGV